MSALPLWVAVAAGVGAAISVANNAWQLGLVLTAVAIGCTFWVAPWRPAAPDASAQANDTGAGTEHPPSVPGWANLVAVLVAAGFAVFSQFIIRTDGDDVFYVNRSVWVAQHGRIPVGDVLFGEDGPILPGITPVSAIETLAGAFARLLHLNAASFVYYLLLPVATFFAVLALWRLIRVWAPRRAVLCLLLAAAFLLWAGGSSASFGSFHLVRAWQGKAIFVSMVVPALYAYISEWAQARCRRSYLLALAAGICGVGLTSSATFVLPLAVAAAGVGMLIRYGVTRWSIREVLLVGLVAVYPVAAGGVVVVLLGSPAGEDTTFQPAETTWDWVVGPGPLTLLGGAALWLGSLLVRRGAAAAIAWGTSSVAFVVMIPGVLEALADASGSSPVLWRSLWLAPVPALVGLLAAVPLPLPAAVRVPRWTVAWVPAAVGVMVLVLAGTPVWASSNRARLGEPQWKVRSVNMADAFAVIRTYPKAKVALAPSSVMWTIPLVTSEVKSVNPRTLYTKSLTDGTSDARLLLSNLANQGAKQPTVEEVDAALSLIDVDVACVNRRNEEGMRKLREAGFGAERQVGRSLSCVTSGPEQTAAPA